MNNQIKELAREAGLPVSDNLERFAELIVNKCALIAEETPVFTVFQAQKEIPEAILTLIEET